MAACHGKRFAFVGLPSFDGDVGDAAALAEYAAVLNYLSESPLYKQKSFDEWATFEKADPWLIAIAKAHDYTIVTMEERNRNLNPSNPTSKEPRIPDVCDALGVKCINLYDLMHEKKCVI